MLGLNTSKLIELLKSLLKLMYRKSKVYLYYYSLVVNIMQGVWFASVLCIDISSFYYEPMPKDVLRDEIKQTN